MSILPSSPSPRPYFIALAVLVSSWALGLSLVSGWGWLAEHWPMSVTMVLGSFVAGSTPAGGASVAFPVFTKALEIESIQAATFGLMIQSVGMSMASLFILSCRIPIYGQVYRWGAAGGSIGVLVGLALLRIPPPFPKLLFTCLVLSFAIALWATRRPHFEIRPRPLDGAARKHFVTTGFAGGLLASQTGSGTDMMIFMVMMLAYHLDGRRAIPTSVIIMTTVSLVGTAGLLIFPHRSIGIVWHYWAVCVPVVAVGAPLGAYVISRLLSKYVYSAVILLIGIEVTSTFVVVSMTSARLLFVGGTLLLAGFMQWRLHRIGSC